MKKSIVFGVAALSAASFMMLSGFDSAETVDSVLEKYREASNAATSFSATTNMNANLSLNIPDMGSTFDALGSGTMDIAVSTDPLALSATGSFSGSAVGQSGSMDIGMYMETAEDGSLNMYVGTGDEWQKQTISAEDAAQLTKMMKEQNIDYSAMPLTYTLGSEPVDVNGTECYQLLTTMTWDDVKNIINWSIDQVDLNALADGDESVAEQEDDIQDSLSEVKSALAMVDPYAAGLQMNFEVDVDTTTYLPMRAHLDMDGSDWSNLVMIAGSMMHMTNDDGSAMKLDLTVNDLFIDYIYNYTDAVVAPVPDNVKSQAVESDLDADLDEISDAIGD